MNSEIEKSPREIGLEQIDHEPSREEVAAMIAKQFYDQYPVLSLAARSNLASAVVSALQSRDERAAKIADERAAFNSRLRDGYRASQEHKYADLKDTRRDEAEIIASAIRGKSK